MGRRTLPLLIVALAWLFTAASCSRVGLLLMEAGYESPSFSIQAAAMGNGNARLSWSLDRGLDAPDLSWSNDSFTVFYAYYLYRSSTSPWNGYQLIHRFYNPRAQCVVTNVDEGSNAQRDLRLSTGSAMNLCVTNLSGFPSVVGDPISFDTPLPALTNYFRLERVELARKSTRDSNEMLVTRTHTMGGDGFSSWVQVVP